MPLASGYATQAQLNRLAGFGLNGGYGEAYAANVYAGTTGLETVGALNVKAGITNPRSYMDMMGVCNLLAGITNPKQYLEVPEALAQIP
jgi:hypothetical protein